jgi:hypothetical protein
MSATINVKAQRVPEVGMARSGKTNRFMPAIIATDSIFYEYLCADLDASGFWKKSPLDRTLKQSDAKTTASGGRQPPDFIYAESGS